MCSVGSGLTPLIGWRPYCQLSGERTCSWSDAYRQTDKKERIIAEARRQDVFVHDAPELVGLLMQLDLDQRIPVRLYQVIAELLVWLQAMNTEDESVSG